MSEEAEFSEEFEEEPVLDLMLPANKLALRNGSFSIELESADPLDNLVSIAVDMYKMAFDSEEERKSISTTVGFVAERSPEEL